MLLQSDFENGNTSFTSLKFYRENFCSTQIIMMSSIPDKAKVNAERFVEVLLPRLIEDCRSVLPFGFIF